MVVRHLAEIDALVIHATLQRNRGRLRLSWTVMMIAEDVAHGFAVGDDVALKVPGATQYVLQQKLTSTCRLAVDRVVGAHH